MRYFYFYICRAGRQDYIGKVRCTLAEVREHFPRALVTLHGSEVGIAKLYHRP